MIPSSSSTSVTSSMYVRVINGESELQALMQTCRLIVIQFWAEWCPPCRQLKPILEQEASSAKIFALALVNIDSHLNVPLVTKYNVSSVPTILLWEQQTNKVIFQCVGYHQNKLKELMDLAYKTMGQSTPARKLKNPNAKCPQGHQLALCGSLPLPYQEGVFYCDLCSKKSVVNEYKKMQHCQPCTFDVCYDCAHE